MSHDLLHNYSPSELRGFFSDYIARGALADGLAFFQRIVAAHPEYGLAWVLLGRLQETIGKDEEAYYAFYQGALTSERSPRVPPQAKVSNFFDLTKFCLRRGHLERTRRHLEEVLLLAPGHAEAQNLRRQLSGSAAAGADPSAPRRDGPKVVEPPERPPTGPLPPSTVATRSIAEEQKHTPVGGVSNLMGRAHHAFTEGRLDEAVKLYRRAVDANPRASSAYISLAQTYNRLGALDQMEQALLEARGRPTDNEIAVLQTLGQVYMKKGAHQKVVDVYTEIVGKARSDSQKVGAYQWIGKGYAELGQLDEARKAYLSALELAPTNGYIRKMLQKADRLLAIGRGEIPPTPTLIDEAASLEDPEVAAWGEDEGSALAPESSGISYMLEADADRLAWRDPEIVSRGGIVRLEDARRLMQDALSAEEAFGTKAMRFLEAAKAFGALDESERDPNPHQEALQRYASQQGGHYLLQLIGEIKRGPQARPDRNRWLRDAACAYYVEAMKILQRRRPQFMFFILQKYLQARLLLEAEEAEAAQLFGPLDGSWPLDLIFHQASKHPVPTVLETVVRGLLELGRAQMGLVREAYDNQRIRRAIIRHRERWRDALVKLGGRPAGPIPDAMRAVISAWRNAERTARVKFSEVYNYPATLDTIADVRAGLEELLTFEGVFSDSDNVLLRDTIDNVLSQLVRYGELPRGSSAERDLLAERTRQRIRGLRERINNYPTYWGRVYFDALLQKWERLLGRAEEARLAEIRPELSVGLESKRLPSGEPESAVVFSVANGGQATALNASFQLLTTDAAYACDENAVALGNIAPGASATAQVRLRLPADRVGLKFLTVRYRVSYWSADKEEALPVREDTVHFGDFRPIQQNPFDESPPVSNPQMFKGRGELLSWLTEKLKGEGRTRSTLLYGLTRTGKTSILMQLQKRILFAPVAIAGPGDPYRLLPVLLPFDRCAGRNRAEDFYAAIFEIVKEQLDTLAVMHPEHEDTLPRVEATRYRKP